MREIDEVIKSRKTQKVLADKTWDVNANQDEYAKTITELLDLAAYAPYHKKCDEKFVKNQKLNSCVPWRFYVLDSANCRLLLDYINKEAIKAGKISNMLAAADALLIVTWLPDSLEDTANIEREANEEATFSGSLKNMEHIAAASAAIQNVLIGATARDIPNYWSSGGPLRMSQLRTYLKISLEEVLLGAVFLFPKNIEALNAVVKLGQLREQGKEKTSWSKWINLRE